MSMFDTKVRPRTGSDTPTDTVPQHTDTIEVHHGISRQQRNGSEPIEALRQIIKNGALNRVEEENPIDKLMVAAIRQIYEEGISQNFQAMLLSDFVSARQSNEHFCAQPAVQTYLTTPEIRSTLEKFRLEITPDEVTRGMVNWFYIDEAESQQTYGSEIYLSFQVPKIEFFHSGKIAGVTVGTLPLASLRKITLSSDLRHEAAGIRTLLIENGLDNVTVEVS